MGKRKRRQPEAVKAYLSYLTKSRYLKKLKTDTVCRWYFEVLKRNDVDPFVVSRDDPLYGEGGSVMFPEDWA
jgi:hypothetical protein